MIERLAQRAGGEAASGARAAPTSESLVALRLRDVSNSDPSACRVCAGPLKFWATAREMAFGMNESFDYRECGKCGCLQIAEIPVDLERFYPDADRARHLDPQARRLASKSSMLHRAWTDLRLWLGRSGRGLAGRRYGRFDWFTRTDTRRRSAILDVGCGSGRLLSRLAREGFEDLTGIDPATPDRGASDVSPRFLAESLEVHAARGAPGSDSTKAAYQLVMAHHSFEHVRDPRRAIDSLARLVAPGGWLLLRLPVADSWACRHYKSDWVQLDAPRHLHLHTRRSIEWLGASAGFRLARIVDDSGPFQVWGSELYRRGVPLAKAREERHRLWGRESVVAARVRASWLRKRQLGDQACFYLQRNA